MANENTKTSDCNSGKKVVISIPDATIKLREKTSFPDSVQPAANAGFTAEKIKGEGKRD